MNNSISGIYAILNTQNGKVYIGSAVNFKTRWRKHRYTLNNNRHHNIYLQRAWNKYGAANFQFEILEHCQVDQLEERENDFIKIYKIKGTAYNISDYAKTPMLGKKHSEETRQKFKVLRENISDETRLKMSEAHKGKAPGNKGKPVSKETRQKLSDANKRRLPPTEETRRKNSEAQKGHICSEETRRKISETQKLRYAHKRELENAVEVEQYEAEERE